jgi:hypothetical protein
MLLGPAEMAAPQTPSSISVRLINKLSTESAQPGDTFTASLAEPLVVDGRVIAQKNARVRGQVREAVSSGRLKRPALLTLTLDNLQSSSRSLPIETQDLTIKAGSHTTRNVVIIGGSTGAGAIIGGIAGGGKGAVIGAATGAGAGTLAAFLTGKREIELPSETLLTFESVSTSLSQRELARYPRAGSGTTAYQEDADSRERQGSDSATSRQRNRRRAADADDDGDEAEFDRDGDRDWRPVFTRRERVLISDWFGSNRNGLPPGLAKRDRLPPGLEKQLRERGTLPPGLQKKVRPLPYDLERQLRRLPSGYRRVALGGNVILMEEKTALIYDILRDVIR